MGRSGRPSPLVDIQLSTGASGSGLFWSAEAEPRTEAEAITSWGAHGKGLYWDRVVGHATGHLDGSKVRPSLRTSFRVHLSFLRRVRK